MAGSTTYKIFNFQKLQDLQTFLNTGSTASPGGPVVQTSIVEIMQDSGNGQYVLVLAPGY